MSIQLDVEVQASELAYSINHSFGGSWEKMTDFILDLDDCVCDLDFTRALRDRLTEIIDQFEEV